MKEVLIFSLALIGVALIGAVGGATCAVLVTGV